MLNFNLFESVKKDPDGDLNTYRVNLQPRYTPINNFRNSNLNTSHVNLQHGPRPAATNGLEHLNTSHVNLQPI